MSKKKRSILNLKKNWPILFALAYIINPFDLPGPIDDLIVTVVMSGIRVLISGKEKKKRS